MKREGRIIILIYHYIKKKNELKRKLYVIQERAITVSCLVKLFYRFIYY